MQTMVNDQNRNKRARVQATESIESAPSDSREAAKAINRPTLIPPPYLPTDMTVWGNAFVLVDKPKGWTSFDVCNKLRFTIASLLGVKSRSLKVGHAGTLDPMATGLLIVCVGRGTKSVESFMAQSKEYSGVLRLGEGTSTYDADSEIIERLPWEHITEERLQVARDTFLGDIVQVPPMHSAIRVGGKRLYESARKGEVVERTARPVRVDRFEVTQRGQDVSFYVQCGKGTYIRSLAHDLAQKLDTTAHLTALRREAIGEHRVSEAWNVEELVDTLKGNQVTKNV